MTIVAPQASAPADEHRQFDLLESGEQYFPAVFASIAQARREVLIETFILFEDEVGTGLQRTLIAAAKRGVQIDLTIDGYGSPDLSDSFTQALIDVGVRIHVYDPRQRLFGLRTNIFRRLHRKLTVIDGEIAYVGGINYSIDQLAEKRPIGKLDFAVRISGEVVATIRQFMCEQIGVRESGERHHRQRARRPPAAAATIAEFVIRDNDTHRDDIERQYRRAIHGARTEIILCNAYFFPGYRLLSALRHAARRGVRVTLILQGAPDMPGVKRWEKLLYAPLLQAGVQIQEYVQHPVHAKVAVIDQRWSTVGSSNLDPLSLTLNLEANVIIRDPAFCQALHRRLHNIVEHDCRAVTPDRTQRHGKIAILVQTAAYHMTRHFPLLAGWLPAHIPQLHSLHTERLRHMQRRTFDRESVL